MRVSSPPHDRRRWAALAGAVLVMGGVSAVAAGPAAAAPPPQAPGTYRGLGFDTCVAPDQATMDAWRAKSPFRAVGIYISGNSRYCGDAYQPNLSPGWVRTNAARGWRFIPIHVGYQSPCFKNNPKSRVQKKHMSRNIRTARQQAAADAVETIRALSRLGFGRGSVSYLDIEWYKRTKECDNAVLEFIDQWTETLRRNGYRSGVYSSGSAAIQAMDQAHTGRRAGFTAPDQVWIAWTNKKADTDGGPYLNDAYWKRQRIHQYHNGDRVTFGGKTLTIDWNALDVRGTSAAPVKGQPTQSTGYRCSSVAKAAAGSTPYLKYGSKGSAVTRVQRALALTGRNVPISGYYGYMTEAATWSYRKANGLGTSKKVAREMWAALQRGDCR